MSPKGYNPQNATKAGTMILVFVALLVGGGLGFVMSQSFASNESMVVGDSFVSKDTGFPNDIRKTEARSRALLPLCPDGHWPIGIKIPASAQFVEDYTMMWYFFRGKTRGSFLEIGGCNGNWMSNSLMLESYFGWTGVMIEANPLNFEEMARNRPRAITLKGMVCEASRSGEEVNFLFQMETKKEDQANCTLNPFYCAQKTTCYTVPELMEKAGWGDEGFDLLSLDIEGHEIIFLEQFDFERNPVRLAVVETDKHTEPEQKKIEEILGKAGLKIIELEGTNRVNSWFLSEELMKFHKTPPTLAKPPLEYLANRGRETGDKPPFPLFSKGSGLVLNRAWKKLNDDVFACTPVI